MDNENLCKSIGNVSINSTICKHYAGYSAGLSKPGSICIPRSHSSIHRAMHGTQGERGMYRTTVLDLFSVPLNNKHDVEVLVYCLISNHIHLIMVPATDDGLMRVLKPVHMRYAQRINREREWKGHFWQGRFFSSPLDEVYLWAAMRYVECNPVRAGMVQRAEEYPWSSAAAHCLNKSDSLLNMDSVWSKQFLAQKDWSKWLAQTDGVEEIERLRKNADKGLPCGSEDFIRQLGLKVGRALEYRPRGRPKKKEIEGVNVLKG